MKRTTILATAAVAALGLLALAGAATASASSFVTERYPSFVKGTTLEGTSARLTAFGSTQTCAAPSVKTALQNGPTENLTSETPEDTACYGYIGESLQWNGCKLVLEPTNSKTRVTCPEGVYPTIKLYPWWSCAVNLKYQEIVGGTFFKNEVGGVVDAYAYIKFYATPSSKSCNASEGTVTYEPSWRLTGYDKSESATGLSVKAAVGAYLAGEKSGEEAKQPRVEAEKYPITLAGIGTTSFTNASNSIKCEGTGLYGSVSGVTKDLSLNAAYGSCALTVGNPVTADVHSCHYTVHVQNVGPPYTGSFGVACEKGGDAIEYKVFSGESLICTVKIGAQSGLEGVGLSNVGSGSGRRVALAAEVKGIAYEKSGLCGNKSMTDGVWSGSMTLSGLG